MCTVSVVPHGPGLRLTANRDERLTRTRAWPPRWRDVEGRPALYPIDPDGGGTWIGVNDAGLAVALLNRTVDHDPPAPGPVRSRGLIVPPLLAHGSLESALAELLDHDPRRTLPFRIVLLQGHAGVVAASNGREFCTCGITLDRPRLLTSSSLGDERVDRVRRPLFDEMVLKSPDGWLAGQERFHAHAWPAAPALSVLMSRTDARTVSRSTIDTGHDPVTFTYEPFESAPGDSIVEAWGQAC